MPNSRQRREAERRRLQRQLQRRQQREASRRRITLIATIIGVLAIAGIVIGVVVAMNNDHSTNPPQAGGSKGTTPTTSPTTSPASSPVTSSSSDSPVAPGTCAYTKSGAAAKKVSLPPSHVPTKGTVTAKVQTSQGTMTFTLDRAATPCTVASFVSLAQQKYFDNTPCHRLTTSGIYVLQCGDPTGTGSGGPGYQFNDELSGHEKYTRGVLAMANAGANTNGSQFFIVYKNSQLPPSYTVFGHVTAGLGVVDKVAAKGVAGGGTDGKPALPVTITKVTTALAPRQ